MSRSDDPRERVLSVRLNDSEHRALVSRAEWAGLSLSEFIRDRLLRPSPQPVGVQAVTIAAAAGPTIGWVKPDGEIQYGGTYTIRCGGQ